MEQCMVVLLKKLAPLNFSTPFTEGWKMVSNFGESCHAYML